LAGTRRKPRRVKFRGDFAGFSVSVGWVVRQMGSNDCATFRCRCAVFSATRCRRPRFEKGAARPDKPPATTMQSVVGSDHSRAVQDVLAQLGALGSVSREPAAVPHLSPANSAPSNTRWPATCRWRTRTSSPACCWRSTPWWAAACSTKRWLSGAWQGAQPLTRPPRWQLRAGGQPEKGRGHGVPRGRVQAQSALCGSWLGLAPHSLATPVLSGERRLGVVPT
jgi:hypothetical protein